MSQKKEQRETSVRVAKWKGAGGGGKEAALSEPDMKTREWHTRGLLPFKGLRLGPFVGDRGLMWLCSRSQVPSLFQEPRDAETAVGREGAETKALRGGLVVLHPQMLSYLLSSILIALKNTFILQNVKYTQEYRE